VSDEPRTPGAQAGSLERVRTFLTTRGLADQVVVFDRSTRTAQMAADAIGCELGQIVKSLVFSGDSGAVLALVAGDRRGDPEAIARAIGASGISIADADAVRDATGYAIGGVSPFDLPEGLPVLIDDSLRRFDVVWSAAGTPDSVVPLGLDVLADITGGTWSAISR
jgi:prolyl-tRNA editing enzyme YbaK/EbsC (Cys-tRNA(Pro) deacylase)